MVLTRLIPIGNNQPYQAQGLISEGVKMAHSKKQGQEAFALLTQWRSEGVPDLITKSEAFNLTNGKVGKPYPAGKSEGIRLVDVAVKMAKGKN
jgi:hypothetical protein